MKQWKRLFASMLAVAMLFAIALPAFAEEDLSGKTVILHTNDMHSRVDANLGYATVKAYKDALEAQGATVLVLDAGDTFHGLPIANLSQGQDIVDIMNAVGYTAMTPGNHDFNYGVERLIDLSNGADFDVLTCNLTDKDGKPVFAAGKVYGDVGVVGISTPETATKTNPLNVEGYVFNPDTMAELLQAAIDEVKAQGAKTVVVLGHLGIDPESDPWRSTDIIPQVSGVNVFVDGHSHSVLGVEGEKDADGNVISYSSAGETVKDKDGNDVLLVQTGCYGATIGKVTIDGDKYTAELLAADDKNADVTKLIEDKMAEIQPMLDTVVAKTDVALNGERETVRAAESNLGNLAADALRYVADADAALTNGGGIRISLEPGDITYGDMNAVFPFGNTVNKLEVTGAQILAALEHGTSKCPELSGAFPQVSGITYKLDATKTENRVSDVTVGGAPLDESKTYTLATNDFTAIGGDGYDMFKEAKLLGIFGALDEALVTYVESALKGTVDATYAEARGDVAITLPAPAAEEAAAQTAATEKPAPSGVDTGDAAYLWIVLMAACAACLIARRRREA
ncbi:MAG: bifunctional UDP-sugar hydrolase/5'-nucleotidase [Clostridia bacterium]|nr:bifunctional UDP-sugar hydrolase/5'-nucleotidase [Clostridia bacterium]